MYGYLILDPKQTGRRAVLEHRMLCGLSVLQARVPVPEGLPEKRRTRRVFQAAVRLWNSGVSRVLTPRSFPEREALRRTGLAEVETAELCRAAAAPLTVTALTLRGWEPGRAVVALAGERVSGPLLRAAETLAVQVNCLQIHVPVGGRELAEYLHEEYGLPVLLPGTVRPALTVDFDGSWEGRGAALRLWGEQPDLLGAEVWVPGLELPEECDPMPLLAALRDSGMLSDSSLRARPGRNDP